MLPGKRRESLGGEFGTASARLQLIATLILMMMIAMIDDDDEYMIMMMMMMVVVAIVLRLCLDVVR